MSRFCIIPDGFADHRLLVLEPNRDLILLSPYLPKLYLVDSIVRFELQQLPVAFVLLVRWEVGHSVEYGVALQ